MKVESLGRWQIDLQWILHLFYVENTAREPWALTDRFAINSALILLRTWTNLASFLTREWTWRALGYDGQMYNGTCIHVTKRPNMERFGLWVDRSAMDSRLMLLRQEAGEPWLLTNRFAMDFVLISWRALSWRVPSSDRQVYNGFSTDSVKRIKLESPKLWWADLQLVQSWFY